MHLSPTSVPLDFPDFGASLSVLDSVPLSLLLGKSWRVLCKVLNFARLGIAPCQSRILLWPSAPVFRGFSQHLRFAEPDMKVRRYFTDERFASLIQTVQEVPITTVVFIKRPSFDSDAIGLRSVDQVQRDLWLGFKLDIVRDVVFFRRSTSSAHSLGRYSRASNRQWKSSPV